MLIYLRHADDGADKSEIEYPHDPCITKGAKEEIRKLALELIAQFGMPDRIYVSPMHRTIETVNMMKKVLGPHVKIIVDYHLSRYFSSSEQAEYKVRPETLAHNPPIVESYSDFKHRVDRHADRVLKKGFHKRKVIWCMGHALVLKRVAKRFQVPLPEAIPFLHWFKIDGPCGDHSS